MSNVTSIEQEWFSWSDWDGDIECMQFTHCLLRKDIGPFKSGMQVNLIELDYFNSQIRIYQTEEIAATGAPSWRGKLSLSIQG